MMPQALLLAAPLPVLPRCQPFWVWRRPRRGAPTRRGNDPGDVSDLSASAKSPVAVRRPDAAADPALARPVLHEFDGGRGAGRVPVRDQAVRYSGAPIDYQITLDRTTGTGVCNRHAGGLARPDTFLIRFPGHVAAHAERRILVPPALLYRVSQARPCRVPCGGAICSCRQATHGPLRWTRAAGATRTRATSSRRC